MYQPWHDPAVFAPVRVDPYGHTVIWYTPPVDVDLVARWLYTEITGVTMPESTERHGPEPLGRFAYWQIKQWERCWPLRQHLSRGKRQQREWPDM